MWIWILILIFGGHTQFEYTINQVGFRIFCSYFFFLSFPPSTPHPNHESLHNTGNFTHASLPRPHARRELASEQNHTQRQGLLSTVAGIFFFF